MTTATWTKLNSGAWGLRVQGSVQAGALVTATTKAGKTETKRVAKVVWQGNGISLCAIESDQPSAHASCRSHAPRRGGRYECDECGEYVTPGTVCWETGAAH